MNEHRTAPFPVTFEIAQQVIRAEIQRLRDQEEELLPAVDEAKAKMRRAQDDIESLERELRGAVHAVRTAPAKADYEAASRRRDELSLAMQRASSRLRRITRDSDPLRTRYLTLVNERERLERQVGDRRPWRNVDFPSPVSGRGKGPDPNVEYKVRVVYEGEGRID